MSTLTLALDQHLATLRVYWRAHRTFPAIAELTSVLGMASTGGVHKTLGKLVDAGLLERVGSTLRCLQRVDQRSLELAVRSGSRSVRLLPDDCPRIYLDLVQRDDGSKGGKFGLEESNLFWQRGFLSAVAIKLSTQLRS